MQSLNLINRASFTACRCVAISNSFHVRNFKNIQKDLKENINSLKLKREIMNNELRENFEPIYRFPKMKGIAVIHRLKNYQLFITAVGIPITAYSALPEFAYFFTYMGVTLTASLCIASYFLKDSIGAVYVNKKDRDEIRIAYVDFFGKRIDKSFEIHEIEPLGPANIFTKVKFIDSKHHNLKFLLKNSEILDSEEFSRVFGDE
jgi:hypothetical protein